METDQIPKIPKIPNGVASLNPTFAVPARFPTDQRMRPGAALPSRELSKGTPAILLCQLFYAHSNNAQKERLWKTPITAASDVQVGLCDYVAATKQNAQPNALAVFGWPEC